MTLTAKRRFAGLRARLLESGASGRGNGSAPQGSVPRDPDHGCANTLLHAQSNADGTLRFMLRALRSRNYRLFSGPLASDRHVDGEGGPPVAVILSVAKASMRTRHGRVLGVGGSWGKPARLLLSPWRGVSMTVE